MAAHNVWVIEAELIEAVGTRSGADDFVQKCCLAGSVYAQMRVGLLLQVDVPLWNTGDTLVYDPTTAARKEGALAAAVWYYNSPQAPFGVLGGTDTQQFISARRIPMADAALALEIEVFGIA